MSQEQAREPVQALIGSRIFVLRGQRVMLNSDLAELYGVQTKVLVQALKRKLERFPADFCFSCRIALTRPPVLVAVDQAIAFDLTRLPSPFFFFTIYLS